MTNSRRKFLGCILGGAAVAGAAGIGLMKFGRVGGRGTAAPGTPEHASLRAELESVYEPRYLGVDLADRAKKLHAMMDNCRLCPRECGAPRNRGRAGICSTADRFRVASFGPHFGEERPLVGNHGSGTIFFSNCSLLCVFCQNWEINHKGEGTEVTHEQLADMMLSLQRRGCHNINFVTPTHLVPHIVSALAIAVPKGLKIPLLYNTGGYDSLEVIKLLDGIIDVYLPDFKYQDSDVAARFSKGAPDYQKHTAAAIIEMHRQVGHLSSIDGIAYRGLLIRHLILPENLSQTDEFVKWTVQNLGADTHVNIMGQYRPMFRASEFPPLDRRVTRTEFDQAMRWARAAGLKNFW